MANYFVVKPRKNNKKEKLTLVVERMDHQGQGVAYLNKQPVFIQGALPAEQVKVIINEQKSKLSKAKLVEIIKPSVDREVAKCQHYQQCGGCELQHLKHNKQLDFKKNKLEELFSRQNITQNLPWQTRILADAWHYRRKARIGVQYTKQGQPIIGFRRRGSNQLQPIKKCVVLVHPLAELFQPLRQLISGLSQSKAIGHIEVIYSENKTNLKNITLVIRQLKTLNKKDKSLWLSAAEQNNWQIIIDEGQSSYALTANNSLDYYLPNNIKINFQYDDFIQVNENINQQMIMQALTWLALHPKDVVLDLFCGLGNFSLPIAKQVQQVIGIEGVLDMVKRAQQNAFDNNISNADFFQADLNAPWLTQSWAKQAFTKVILDPARAGAHIAVGQLIKLKIPTILYVSCDPATLAQESKLLIEAGYQIIKIALIDMFAHTKHSETMVLFRLN